MTTAGRITSGLTTQINWATESLLQMELVLHADRNYRIRYEERFTPH